jgi:uncharacterized membrane protein
VLLTQDFCLLYFSFLNIEAIYSSETRLAVNRLHRVLSQAIKLSVTTAVRTWNPVFNILFPYVSLQVAIFSTLSVKTYQDLYFLVVAVMRINHKGLTVNKDILCQS